MSANPQDSKALVAPSESVSLALDAQDSILRGLLEGTGVSPMKFRQDVLLTLAKTPKLREACQTLTGVSSLVAAARDAAQLGLRVGSTLGHCALVPYKDEVKLIVMYQGKVELALKSGLVRSISSGAVRENDEFDYQEGSGGFARHKRCLIGDRGQLIAAYAVATFPDGQTQVRVIDRTEAMRARDKSQGYAYAARKNPQAPDHAWVTHEDEMWAKTAVHRLSKMMPKSPKLADCVAGGHTMVEDEADAEEQLLLIPDEQHEPVRATVTVVRADGSRVDTETGEVSDLPPAAGVWKMTEGRRKAIFTAIKGTPVTPQALGAAMVSAGMPDDTKLLTEEQYLRMFDLIDELVRSSSSGEIPF